MKKNLLFTLLLINTIGVNAQRWDFTSWSAATVANLKAVNSSNTEWSDIEKAADTAPTDISKENCFWQVVASGADGITLSANGEPIKETEGLIFTNTSTRSLAIAVNYPTTSLGTYNGPSYLWLGSTNQNYIVIPNVKPGTEITIGLESHKPSDARGIDLFIGRGNSGTKLLAPDGSTNPYPTTYVEQTWLVPDDAVDTPNEDGTFDITIRNTKGCHLYFIQVGDDISDGGNTPDDGGDNVPGDNDDNTPDDGGGNDPGDNDDNTPDGGGDNTSGDNDDNTPDGGGDNTPSIGDNETSGFGYDFEAGGLYYNIVSREEALVEVTSFPFIASEATLTEETNYDYARYSGSITIPGTVAYDGKTYRVVRIAEAAFEDCTELTEIIMSDNIVDIGENAFRNCTTLKNVRLSENIEKLNHGVFAFCTSLKNIVIPDNVNTLCGYYGVSVSSSYDHPTFEECASLETVTFGRNLLYITAGDRTRGMFNYEYNPFRGCSSLKKVIMRSEVVVKTLTQTFGENVEEIILDSTVRDFEDEAFAYLTSLKRLVVNSKFVGDGIFRGCSNLTDLTLSEGLEHIGEKAFEGCSSLLKLDIPKSVKVIGSDAFDNCTSLARITLGDSIVSVGKNPFSNTRWYNNRPDGEIYIGKLFLGYRVPLENSILNIKEGTMCIVDYALNGCSNLDSLYIPNSVVYVGEGVCQNCTSLQHVDLPADMEVIYGNAFNGCEKLTTIKWSENLDSIGESAFYECESLATLNLPNTVTAIGANAFAGCSVLKEVNLPHSLKVIGESAFSSCPMYEDVEIPNAVVSIGAYAFSNGWSWGEERMKRVTIPHSVEYIDEMAFSSTSLVYLSVNSDYLVKEMPAYCAPLASTPSEVVFGDSVTTIIPSIFENDLSLTSLVFGANVKEIGDFAFCGCKSLSEIILLTKEIPTVGMDCFLNLAKDCKIYVPDPEAYREAWPEYAHMIVDIAGVVQIEEQTFTYTGQVPEIAYTSKVPVNVIFDELMVDAGTYETKGQAIFTLGDDTVTRTVDCTYTIGKAPLYVIAADTSRVYGEENPEFEVSLYGFVNEEDSMVLTSLPTAYSDATTESNVGKYTIYTVGGEANNYEFVCHTAILTVEKAEQTVVWNLETDTVVLGSQLELKAMATSGLQVFYFQYDTMTEEIYELEGLYMQDGKYYLDCTEVGVVHILAFQDGMMEEHENYHTAYVMKELVIVEPELYALTYLVDGDVFYADSLAEGDDIILPEEPVKEGYTFSGWSEVPETMPAEDVTVTGYFTINKYLVTFKIGDEVIAADSLEYGAAIVAPDAPDREGYTFDGWGEVAETVPASDVTYEGSYTVNIYKVYYYVDEELVHTAEVAYGEAIPEYIYEPTKEGDIFEGWIGETYETMPAHDVTYTANIANGIEHLTIDKSQLTIYDLLGRKVTDTENLKGGIYIVNGQKIFIK